MITDGNTTLEYFDGFDDYNTSQLNRYWSSQYNSPNNTVTLIGTAFNPATFSITSNGRNGSGLRFTSDNGGSGICIARTDSSQATRTIGFALNLTRFTDTNNIVRFSFGFADSAVLQFWARVNTDGTISLIRSGTGSSGTVIDTSSNAITLGTWYYIEFSATINNSTGAYTVKVNGVSWLTGSSANTRGTANNSANQVFLGVMGSSGNTSQNIIADVDDFYSRTDNIFCGNCIVETKLPTGNGATNNFTRGGTDSGTNWGQVNNNPSDDNTSYNISSSTNDIDLYTYPTLSSTSGTIYGVMIIPVIANFPSGLITACTEIRVSSTNYAGVTQNIGANSYNSYPEIYGFNPATVASWTVSDINSAQFGLKRLS